MRFNLHSFFLGTDNDMDKEARTELTNSVSEKLRSFEQSADIEVQERACSLLQLLKYIQRELNNGDGDNTAEESSGGGGVCGEMWTLFEGELNPVAPKAQRKVPVPDGLDLDAWINDPPSDDEPTPDEIEQQQRAKGTMSSGGGAESSSVYSSSSKGGGGGAGLFTYAMSSQNYSTGAAVYNNQQTSSLGAKKIMPELSQDDIAKLKDARKQQQDSNPFYIKSGGGGGGGMKKSETNANKLKLEGGSGSGSGGETRSMSIELKTPFSIPGVPSSETFYRASKIDDENEKLKKKMMKKKKQEAEKAAKKTAKHKGKKKTQQRDEDEDEPEVEEDEAPKVKVLENEMPEGAVDVSDDERDRKKLDPKDPHRALNINLDEPLKDDEVCCLSVFPFYL